ncbi:MAG: lytic transglycosylase domain-containing protein, partial [Longimicrobiales bacterium]
SDDAVQAATTAESGVDGVSTSSGSSNGEGGASGERRFVERRRAPGVRRNRTVGFLERFRQPIIGVGLAGAALPMVASMAPGSPSEAPEAGDESASRTALPAEDVEEALAERVDNEREMRERERMVQASVAEYGIARDLAEAIYDAAREEGIEPEVAFGLVRTESTFREDARSHVGALGLTQVMPRTAAWLEPGTTSKDLYERDTNLRLGFRYLDQMIDKYKGDLKLALLAYNRGPGTVDRVLDRGGNPDNGYADKVLR